MLGFPSDRNTSLGQHAINSLCHGQCPLLGGRDSRSLTRSPRKQDLTWLPRLHQARPIDSWGGRELPAARPSGLSVGDLPRGSCITVTPRLTLEKRPWPRQGLLLSCPQLPVSERPCVAPSLAYLSFCQCTASTVSVINQKCPCNKSPSSEMQSKVTVRPQRRH